MVQLNIKNFPDELYKELKKEAEEKGISLSQYVIDILEKRHLQSLCYESIEPRVRLDIVYHKFEPRQCPICKNSISKGEMAVLLRGDKYNMLLCSKCGLGLIEKLLELKRIDANTSKLIKKIVEHEIRLKELQLKLNVIKKEYDVYQTLAIIERSLGELLRTTYSINQRIMATENRELKELLRDIDTKLGDTYTLLNAIKDKIKAKVEEKPRKKESKKKEKKEKEKPWVVDRIWQYKYNPETGVHEPTGL